MCSPVKCKNCGRVTWSGCGDHVDQVMATVPVDQRCVCNALPSTTQAPEDPPLNSERTRGFWRKFKR